MDPKFTKPFFQNQSQPLSHTVRAFQFKWSQFLIICIARLKNITSIIFSKSVLDIKTRLVVTVELQTKWMPNSDSASNFMLEYKFLGY